MATIKSPLSLEDKQMTGLIDTFLRPFAEVVAGIVIERLEKKDDDNKPEEIQYMSREDAAKALRITLPTLRKYSVNGILPCKKIGGRVLYNPDDIRNAVDGLMLKAKLKEG